MEISFAPLDDLAAALEAVEGIRSASVDPAKVTTPGVWIQGTGIELDRLAGYTLTTRLVLVVDNNGQRRAMTALAGLLNKVLTVVDPAGPITPREVTLPGDAGAALPGLAVPFNLLVS